MRCSVPIAYDNNIRHAVVKVYRVLMYYAILLYFSEHRRRHDGRRHRGYGPDRKRKPILQRTCIYEFTTASVLLFGALSHGRNRKSETRRGELGSGATNRVKD